ncbi:ATP-binding cassette domain-containing protein [Nonomuraea sp. PA05]|uniref:ATP-binding cassette domain-containing protein n=1 Tax=Nonomuraea sp. PA05 TaxID=2604466 RepID=UPI001652068C|nr:ABC transporter ATP-binding protein [Nonomuraea sp. PA05]
MALALAVVAGLMPVVETLALARAVDAVARDAAASTLVVLLIVAVVGARIGRGWLQIFSTNAQLAFQRATRAVEYGRMSENLETCRDVGMYENGASQEIVHLGMEGSERHRVSRLQAATMLLQGVLAGALLGSAIATIKWQLGVVALLAAAATGPFHIRNGTRSHTGSVATSVLDRRLGYLRYVLTHPAALIELMAGRATGPLRDTGGTLIARIAVVQRDVERALARSGMAIVATPHLVTAVVLVAGVVSGTVRSAGELSLVIIGFGSLQGSLGIALQGVATLREASLERRRADDLRATIREHTHPIPVDAPTLGTGRNLPVTFDDVFFRYSPQAPWSLNGFTLDIAAGEAVCLVGSNGSGKTTALKLLLGVHRPTRGSVLLDGRDVRDYDPDELAATLRFLLQEPVRLEASLRDNIDRFRGRSRQEVERVARLTAVDRIAARLPHGLDSEISQQFGTDEHGQALSGGEWQRVMFARLLLGGHGLYVLDEPTAALDAEQEAAVIDTLEMELRGATALMVSHRWPLLRLADRIAVVGTGRIREIGTHEELSLAGGAYAQLVEKQRRSLSFLHRDVPERDAGDGVVGLLGGSGEQTMRIGR